MSNIERLGYRASQRVFDQSLLAAAQSRDLNPEALMRRMIDVAAATASVHGLEAQFAAAVAGATGALLARVNQRIAGGAA